MIKWRKYIYNSIFFFFYFEQYFLKFQMDVNKSGCTIDLSWNKIFCRKEFFQKKEIMSQTSLKNEWVVFLWILTFEERKWKWFFDTQKERGFLSSRCYASAFAKEAKKPNKAWPMQQNLFLRIISSDRIQLSLWVVMLVAESQPHEKIKWKETTCSLFFLFLV